MTTDRVLEVDGISKSFGHLKALQDVSCSFFPGEVHAVLGENGAGKSTLAGILSGFVVPDAGQVRLGLHSPEKIPVGDPAKIRQMGIEMVHQHFTLVPELTVEENLGLNQIPRLTARLELDKWAAPALKAGEELGWNFDRGRKVRELSVGVQQRLEIVRVLGNYPQVIIFDEPTAVLAPNEVEELLRILGDLRKQGRIIILIAHKLSEVMAIADRVTVLRKGAKVASAEKGAFDADQLAHWMVGEIPSPTTKLAASVTGLGLVVKGLKVMGDRGQIAIDHLDLEIGRGEILGFGGVDGNGQLELAESLAQIRRIEVGEISWAGTPFMEDLEVAYIPQDRQKDGLAPEMSIVDNLLLSGNRRPEFTWGGFLRRRKVSQWAESLIQGFSIKADSPGQSVKSLSGGNQQKVVVSRNLDRVPDLLIVCNPTRGLDVKAADFVHRQILEARSKGAAVLLISSDLDELGHLADRIQFLSKGKLSVNGSALSLVGGTS